MTILVSKCLENGYLDCFRLLSETNYLLCKKKKNDNKKVGSAQIIFAANEHVFNAILLIVLNDKSLWSNLSMLAPVYFNYLLTSNRNISIKIPQIWMESWAFDINYKS